MTRVLSQIIKHIGGKKSIYDWVIISLEKLVQNFETMKSNLII